MRHVARFACIAATFCAGAAACNEITGVKERTLEARPPRSEIDSGDEDEDGPDPVDEAGKVDQLGRSDADAGPVVIEINVQGDWASPNGAVAQKVTNGVKIGSYGAYNHAVIVPSPLPMITSENYTVRAHVRAPPLSPADAPYNREFGIIARLQPNAADAGADANTHVSYVLASVYGRATPAFVGEMTAAWGPTKRVTGPDYAYVPSALYKMWMRVEGKKVTAKWWSETEDEALVPEFSYTLGSLETGRGVGFYAYELHDAVLEKMTITIP